MENTMLITLTNEKAAKLLHELEKLQLIKVLQENVTPVKTKFSDKYRGMIGPEDGQKLNEHIQQMRSEWSDT